MTFDQWMREVDRILNTKVGLDSRDLADCPYHDWYDSGMTPQEVIGDILVEWNDMDPDLLEELGI